MKVKVETLHFWTLRPTRPDERDGGCFFVLEGWCQRGGYTVSPTLAILSDKLVKTKVGGDNLANWTLGMTAMHELLFHIHPGGRSDGTADVMRTWYHQRTWGHNEKHGPGHKQNYKIR